MMRLFIRSLTLVFAVFVSLSAQMVEKSSGLRLEVRPDREGKFYHTGDTAVFAVKVARPDSLPVARLVYRFTEDGARVLGQGEQPAPGGETILRMSFDRPGFLRLDLTLVCGPDTLEQACACGFDPEAIRPTGVLPEDFDRFWRNARAELLRIPVDPRLEEVPAPEIPGARRFKVSLASVGGSRVYGWLTLPPGEGPFPAVLCVPSAGVKPSDPRAAFTRAGMAVMAINIHGIEEGRDKAYYLGLADGVLDAYRGFGADDPYQFYYRQAIQGAMRALDYLVSRPEVDASRVAVSGGSQGGALSLLLAGLDNRIKALAANVPAMCDHTGSLYGRPSGWPVLFQYGDRERTLRTAGYYDAALNAGLIEVPALLGVGLIDTACPPTTVYAAYNNLRGPRRIDYFPWMGHSEGPGWGEFSIKWLIEQLNRKR
jgi:cephalosporin-C deacetylase